MQNEVQKGRPPVVVVMGHVDHGKTTLLDYIRKTSVAAKESGSITQHIGAYEIEHPSTASGQVRKITFLDTPGHEAFSKMRSRGAKVADIAILVVAADEGVKPQTKEAIRHIQEAKIPFLVALNKIDRPNASPERAKQELASSGVLVEGWGGNAPVVEISSKTGKGIDELLGLVLLLSDMEELKADKSKPAEGIVIESHLDRRRGQMTTLLILNGTLRRGDTIAAGNAFGKVKILENFLGASAEELTVSSPARVLGWETVPKVGDSFRSVSPEELDVLKKEKTEQGPEPVKTSADIRLLIKTDVAGSEEALEEAISKIPHEGIELAILFSGVGDISESDVKFASATNAMIVGFRVRISREAEALLSQNPVPIIQSDIIYELLLRIEKEVKSVEESKLEKATPITFEVTALFGTKAERQIIGGEVRSGTLKKGMRVNILRQGQKIGTGKVVNLQKEKADVTEIEERSECGVLFESEVKITKGDTFEVLTQWKEQSG